MTVTLGEDLTADEFYTADDPDEPGIPAGEDTNTVIDPEAPYGWTIDKETKQRRPKKSPGRPKQPPTAEELAAAPVVELATDRAPSARPRTLPGAPAAEEPMPKAGMIARGVNKLYRRAGKIIRVLDEEIGEAVIACTQPGEDDDLTVGEAWEALCKANPRVRAWVMKLITGGVWGDLIMAHAPIGIALLMKPAIARLIPFRRLVGSFLEPDEDSAEGGLTPEDADAMMDLAEQQARHAASKMGVQVTDKMMADARQQAAKMAGVPPGLRRQQPQNHSRAKRRGK